MITSNDIQNHHLLWRSGFGPKADELKNLESASTKQLSPHEEDSDDSSSGSSSRSDSSSSEDFDDMQKLSPPKSKNERKSIF